MFTPDATQTNPDYFDNFAASSKISSSLVSSTFLSPTPSNYSDSSYQQSPLSVYNNYNPNYHHHHYYFHPSFPDYGFSQPPTNSYDSSANWLRKFDCESQKEYFIANTPPSECFDFEVPQRVTQSPKPTAMKLINDLDKIFFDDQSVNKVKDQLHNSLIGSCETYGPWSMESCASEKQSKQKIKTEGNEKLKKDCKFSKTAKRKEEKGSIDLAIIVRVCSYNRNLNKANHGSVFH